MKECQHSRTSRKTTIKQTAKWGVTGIGVQMYTCTCKPLFIKQCCRRNCNRSKLIVRILTTNKMSLRERLVKRMWWLGWHAESNKSISRRKNVLPGRQAKQIKFSFPISDWSCRFVHDLREHQVRSKSMISWRWDSQSLTVQDKCKDL